MRPDLDEQPTPWPNHTPREIRASVLALPGWRRRELHESMRDDVIARAQDFATVFKSGRDHEQAALNLAFAVGQWDIYRQGRSPLDGPDAGEGE